MAATYHGVWPGMTLPRSLHPLATEVLQKLSAHRAAAEFVLGGYFALQHYTDYRQTHDIDAWWRGRSSPEAEAALRSVMSGVAATHGYTLRERSFGETLSLELYRGSERAFSFQVAVRSVGLEEPVASAWPPILIETLRDNVGSKMNALVNRGAPRDLRDIRHVVGAGLLSTRECWELWRRKNPEQTVESARQKVLHHLETLDTRRPLAGIPDPAERDAARATRLWFREFLEV